MLTIKAKIRRLRFWLRLINAYLNKYKFRILISLTTLTIIILSTKFVIPQISQKHALNIGIIGNYTLETIPSEILTLVTEPLISTDESGRPQGALASHWTVTDDYKTYILFLKNDIKWHDGSDVDAREISLAISKVNITALNNKALRFELSNTLASFLPALNKPVFKSKSFYGTGPERITDIDKTDNIIKKISLTPNDSNLPKVNLKFYANENQAINAFKIGEIKVVNVPGSESFENWPNIDAERKLDESEIVTIFFNNEDNNLSSKELRQALTYAINREDFDGVQAHSPISQKNWTYNESVKRYEYNPAKSKELLAKANIKNPKITLSYTPSFKKLAASIEENWTAIGVDVTIQEETQLPQKFQALLATNKLPPDPDQYTLWHSTQKGAGNLTNYKNVKIDKLLEDGRSINDEPKRKEAYLDFQKFLVEDVPAAFLYYPYKYRLVYKNVKDLVRKLPN